MKRTASLESIGKAVREIEPNLWFQIAGAALFIIFGTVVLGAVVNGLTTYVPIKI